MCNHRVMGEMKLVEVTESDSGRRGALTPICHWAIGTVTSGSSMTAKNLASPGTEAVIGTRRQWPLVFVAIILFL